MLAQRMLLDTNIYGFIMDSPDRELLVESIISQNVIFCGSAVIRQELRNIPKKAMIEGASLRKLCLELYDSLVDEKRNYVVTEIVRQISEEYEANYNGKHSLREFENDFLIVASASLHNIDVVVSNDEKTMVSFEALKAYTAANSRLQLRTPKFIKFGKMAEDLRRAFK